MKRPSPWRWSAAVVSGGAALAALADLALLPRHPLAVGTVDGTVLAGAAWRARPLGRDYRDARQQGQSRWTSLAAALARLPPPLRALVLMDLGSWWALGRLLGGRARRLPGREVLSYGRGERLVGSVLTPLSVIEVLVTGYFAHRTPVWLDWDLAGLAGTWFLLGVILQNTAFPHELTPDRLCIRHGALTRLELPLVLIQSATPSALGFQERALNGPASLWLRTAEGANLALRLRDGWQPRAPVDPALRRSGPDGPAVTRVYLNVDDPVRAARLINRASVTALAHPGAEVGS